MDIETKHILLISFHPPAQGTGSPVILDRHLKRLEIEGWKISIAIPENFLKTPINLPQSWQIIPLISRRWWWPPFREEIPLLVTLRLFLWSLECENKMRKDCPSAILTLLYGVYPLLAANLSQRWNVPMSVIIHDQVELWAKSKNEYKIIHQRTMNVLKKASRIWTVSSNLASVYNLSTEINKVLYPIPEGAQRDISNIESRFNSNPIVAHAGSLHPFQFPNFYELAIALEKINGRLLIVAPKDNSTLGKLQETFPSIIHQEPFPKNQDVADFLYRNATSILISYSFSFEEQAWAKTSFPSKLIEFSHLGLPLIVMAPTGTAISDWIKQHEEIIHIDKLEKDAVLTKLTGLTQKNSWIKMSELALRLSRNEFSPDNIQQQFERELPVSKKTTT